jgi:hypothetical protein
MMGLASLLGTANETGAPVQNSLSAEAAGNQAAAIQSNPSRFFEGAP